MEEEKPQLEKFIEIAKEIGADNKESSDFFERAFEKIIPPKVIKDSPLILQKEKK